MNVLTVLLQAPAGAAFGGRRVLMWDIVLLIWLVLMR